MTRPFIALLILLTSHPAAHAENWVKLCERATTTVRSYEDRTVCLTYHQHVDDTGKLVYSAALREIEGHEKRTFMILVPLGALIEPGLRATIFPKDLWEKVQNFETPDAGNLKDLTVKYAICRADGCVAEVEATPELITDLQDGGGLMVRLAAIGTYAIPLKGFAAALAGPRRELPQQRRRCDQGYWPGCKDR
jgi:invasion protein IalB